MSVERWVEAWTRAWREHDPVVLDAVYAPDAGFRSHPFRELQEPRDYAEWAFAEEDELVSLSWGEPLVAGDRAVVEYWAVVRTGAEQQTIAGVAMLRFCEDGRVVEQHDYWAAEPGRREPPPGWGS